MKKKIALIVLFFVLVETVPPKGRSGPPKRLHRPKRVGSQKLDTEAASRGAQDLDRASPFELRQRVLALSKQNALLCEAQLEARKELEKEGIFSIANRTSTTTLPENLDTLSDFALRQLVIALVTENHDWQRQEHDINTAFRRSEEDPLEDRPAEFFSPSISMCTELNTKSHFQETRYDGSKVPNEQKWKAWLCPQSVWVSKNLAFCEDGRHRTRHYSRESYYENITLQRGPDELYGSLQGQEAVALHWEHQGQCAYNGHFELSVNGKYHLQLVHLRENYAGLNERRPLWAPMHYDFILGTMGLFVSIDQTLHKIQHSDIDCSTFGLVEAARRLTQGRFVFTGTGEPFGHPDRPIKDIYPFLAVAQRTYAWDKTLSPPLRVHYNDEVSWLFAVDPTRYEWRPWTCQLSNRRKCLSEYRILFSGDSNMNALYRAFLGLSCGLTAPQLRKLHPATVCADDINTPLSRQRRCDNELTFNHHAGTCPHLWLASQIQHFGDVFPPAAFSEPNDVLVANFGQWPAAKSHYTQSQYHDIVDKWFSKTRSNATRIWSSTIPLIRNDAWVRAAQDWRTLSRLQLFNEYADQAAKRNGWLVLDEWNLTLPFLLAPREDIAHAAESQRQHHAPLLLSLLCGAIEKE